MSAAGIALFTLGGCWLLFWHRPWRWVGTVAMLAGCAVPLFDRPPSVLISGDGRLVAVRDGDLLWVPNPKVAAFVTEVWRQRLGNPELRAWPRQGTAAGGMIDCNTDRCLIRRDNYRLVVLRRLAAAESACREADMLVSSGLLPWRLKNRGACSGVTVLDRIPLRRDGARALYIDPGGTEIHTVRNSRGERPWTGR